MFGAQEPGRAGLGQRSAPPLMSYHLTNIAPTRVRRRKSAERPRPGDGAEGTAPGTFLPARRETTRETLHPRTRGGNSQRLPCRAAPWQAPSPLSPRPRTTELPHRPRNAPGSPTRSNRKPQRTASCPPKAPLPLLFQTTSMFNKRTVAAFSKTICFSSAFFTHISTNPQEGHTYPQSAKTT